MRTFTFALLTTFALAVRIHQDEAAADLVVSPVTTEVAEVPEVQSAPVEETAPAEQAAPVEETAPAEQDAPVEETAPAESATDLPPAFELPDLSSLGFIPTVEETEEQPAVATANFEFEIPELPDFTATVAEETAPATDINKE